MSGTQRANGPWQRALPHVQHLVGHYPGTRLSSATEARSDATEPNASAPISGPNPGPVSADQNPHGLDTHHAARDLVWLLDRAATHLQWSGRAPAAVPLHHRAVNTADAHLAGNQLWRLFWQRATAFSR